MPTIYKNGLIYGGAAGSANLIQATDVNGGTSNVQVELNKLNVLDFNPAINHNNIYRGIMLVDTVENTGKYTLAQLHNMVSAGNFSDIYIGDIIKVNMAAVTYTPAGGSSTTDPAQDVEWIVMGINTCLKTGDTELTDYHLVLVPKNAFNTTTHMNSTNTTAGGYIASDMFTNILPAYINAVSNSLGNYILTYRSLLSSDMNANAASSACSAQLGCSTAWTWTDVTLNLLSEIEVCGTLISGNIYDTGEKNIQLPGFVLNPILKIKNYGSGTSRADWWLSTIDTAVYFASIRNTGYISGHSASGSYGIVPKVLFG